jgi:hypothetical protein
MNFVKGNSAVAIKEIVHLQHRFSTVSYLHELFEMVDTFFVGFVTLMSPKEKTELEMPEERIYD